MDHRKMRFYLAPMEGITGYIYRNAVRDFYGKDIDRYFSPFVTYHTKRILNTHEREDLRPDHNRGLCLIPQILTNDDKEFLTISHFLKEEYGYDEVNLNFGCPSGTVVSKGRGAGFLAHPDELEKFLYEIFEHAETKISIKTRIGMNDKSVFPELLGIYSQFPLSELIIHPRLRKDMYNGKPDIESFINALGTVRCPVCYNGDIYSVMDYDRLVTMADKTVTGGTDHEASVGADDSADSITEITDNTVTGLQAVMCGRGMISHPYLLSELAAAERGVQAADAQDGEHGADGRRDSACTGAGNVKRLREFHDRIVADYMLCYEGDGGLVLRKMKEIWTYMIAGFPGCGHAFKELCKSRNMVQYSAAVTVIFGSR